LKTKVIIWVSLVALILVSCVSERKGISTQTTIPTSVITTTESTQTLIPSPEKLSTPASKPFLSTKVPTTPGWIVYTSDKLKVSLAYPAYWEVNDEGVVSYSSQDGFINMSASSIVGSTAKEWCEIQIKHNPDKLGIYRYGTQPAMEVLKVDDQPACLVLPSDDQPKSERGSSLLVVEYPTLEGGTIPILFLFADKNHIYDFINTLKFIR